MLVKNDRKNQVFSSRAMENKGLSQSFHTYFPTIKLVQLLFLLIFPLIIATYAHAVTYYVDATSGNDSYNGTEITGPWKTISKVNKSTFQPGDSILFKRGCTWREQLSVPSSGNSGSPITFGAYGTGDAPIISGADVLSSSEWSFYSGNIYVIKVGSIPAPTQLYVDGVYYDMAHHPNSGWLHATSDASNASTIIDTDSSFTNDQIAGAKVMTKAYVWDVSSSIAASYASNTITLNSGDYVYKNDSTRYMKTGYGYYLQNKLWMLDSAGEWFYDSSTGKIYLWAPNSDNPTGHTVEISQRPYGVYINNKYYITIQDIEVANADNSDVYAVASENIIINKIKTTGGYIGISFPTTSSVTITNNTVKNALMNGISPGPGDTWITNRQYNYSGFDINNNIVTNIGNMGACAKVSDCGIGVMGQDVDIESNTISNVGYAGIKMFGQGDIKYNTITNSMLLAGDGGAIYTHRQSGFGNGAKTISNNIIKNVIGDNSGATSFSPITIQAVGIYLDGYADHVTVTDNIIYNSTFGIYNNGGWNNTITNNKVYRSTMYSLVVSELSNHEVTDLVITGNIFESVSSICVSRIWSQKDNTALDFGTYDYNHYYHPNISNVIREIDQTPRSIYHKFAEWQSYSGQDTNSTDSITYATENSNSAPNHPINLVVK